MTEKELFDLLKTKFDRVAYDHFDKKVEPPFVIYEFAQYSVFRADNRNYFNENRFRVYLVTDRKDPALESIIEALFTENDIAFDKDEEFIPSERIYQIEYSI